MIASHYAEPLLRHLVDEATLRHEPSEESLALLKLASGDAFAMLDNSLGWAWGYAGTGRRVGYVKSEALGL